jgi:hypothetical protein
MKPHKIIVHAGLLALSCTAASRAQTTTGVPASPSGAAQTQVQSLPVAVTWSYYPQPKSLLLRLVNNSGKDITAYDITVKNKYIDGTRDDPCCLEHVYNMLGRLVEIQTAKDPAAMERRDRELDNGIFYAGTSRDITLHETKDISDVEAVVDVAFYTDTTFDEHNADAFKLMLASRQRELLTAKKVNAAIENALADKSDDHPSAAALTELTKFAVEQTTKYSVYKQGQQYDPEAGQQFRLQLDIQNLQHYVQAEQNGATERDRLTQYSEYLKKEIEVLTPHCHLEITPSQYNK